MTLAWVLAFIPIYLGARAADRWIVRQEYNRARKILLALHFKTMAGIEADAAPMRWPPPEGRELL